MKRWNLIVDVAECHNCHNCFISNKDEHVGNDFPGYSAPQPLHGHKWINILTRERGRIPMMDVAHVPTMCNHCDNAPCIKLGRGAVQKRTDGIVLIDPKAAIGRKDLVASCPYGAIWWNEELKLPQKWTFDAHLLDSGWSVPRCVQSCPTGALKALKVSDQEMADLAASERLETLMPELETKSRVHYRNLHRYTKLFVGGSVVAERDGVVDCVAQATVELIQESRVHDTTDTDVFGEFKFDALAPRSGAYKVRISHTQYRQESVELNLAEESVVLDCIRLQAA